MSREAALKAWDTRGRKGPSGSPRPGGGFKAGSLAHHRAIQRQFKGGKKTVSRKGIARGSLNRYNQMNYLYNRGFLGAKSFKAYSKSQTGRADYQQAHHLEKGKLTWLKGRQIH